MKRFLILLTLVAAFAFAAQTANAQTRYTKYAYELSDTLLYEDTASFVSPAFDDYYSLISLQLVPVLYGAGDSARFTVRYYQSNSANHVYWTELESKADTLTAAFDAQKGILFNDADYEGTWLKAKVFSTVVADSFYVKAYWEYKKSKEVIF